MSQSITPATDRLTHTKRTPLLTAARQQATVNKALARVTLQQIGRSDSHNSCSQHQSAAALLLPPLLTHQLQLHSRPHPTLAQLRFRCKTFFGMSLSKPAAGSPKRSSSAGGESRHTMATAAGESKEQLWQPHSCFRFIVAHAGVSEAGTSSSSSPPLQLHSLELQHTRPSPPSSWCIN